MYVAVKGGEQAIVDAHRLLAAERRGDPSTLELTLPQIAEQLGLAVDRVMSEGSIYDRELGALAIKQARGDLVEAIFLLRAYRATLPRLSVSRPLDTSAMCIRRRISATFKDVPGGQILGPTFDYTHRLLDFSLAQESHGNGGALAEGTPADGPLPRVVDLLDGEGLIENELPEGSRRSRRRSHPPTADVSRPARRTVAEPRAGRRGLPPRARLRDPAGLRIPSSVRGRNPARRGRGRADPGGAGVPHRRR